MLELKNVTKTFNLTGNAEDKRIALDNISLQIEPGEFVTIIGGNGSGKSTTLNIISGLLQPDSGQVLLNGIDITKKKDYQRAGYFGHVFQDPMMGTSGNMSVLENLEIAYIRGHFHSPIRWGFKKDDKEYFIEELKRFDLGLETRLNQKVGVMSGGQRQALTLLMATMRNHPSKRMMRHDYILFSGKDENIAKQEFDNSAIRIQNELRINIDSIKCSGYDKAKKYEQIKLAKHEAKNQLLAQFDLTKQILLLDEHTAALDPKTAKKVLDLTDKIVKENKMTTLMITHNMKDAITYGDRLIMFHLGHIILDVRGNEKKKLTPEDLLRMFDEADERAIME
jgi:ABC-type uncharacterized transport system ATPase component